MAKNKQIGFIVLLLWALFVLGNYVAFVLCRGNICLR